MPTLPPDKTRKAMCKLIRLLLLSLAVISCRKALLDTPPRSLPPTVRPGQRDTLDAPGDSPPGVPDIYATAVCFPDSVDFRGGAWTEGGHILLLKNGVEVLRVPFSGKADADRHRLWGPDLWTDSSDGSEVTVCCNGKERFRIAADEILRGFALSGGRVYTLGQRQGREGLSLRADGEELFSAPTGTVLGSPDDADWESGALCPDGENIYFCYGIPIWEEGRVRWEYRVMERDRLVKTIRPGEVEGLYDLRVRDGMVYRSERKGGSLCLVKGDSYHALRTNPKEELHLCKLAPLDGQLVVKGSSFLSGSNSDHSAWMMAPGMTPLTIRGPTRFAEILAGEGHTAALMENNQGYARMVQYDGNGLYPGHMRYRLVSRRCIKLHKGVLGVALSDQRGTRHLLMRNLDTLSVRFNGYFTSILIH